MPFVSNSQRRRFYAMEARGDLPEGTAARWEVHTSPGEKLPERLHPKTAHAQGQTDAFAAFGVEKVAFLPAVGAALATAGRAALPWLGRAFTGNFGKQLAAGAAQQGLAMGAQRFLSRPPQQPDSIGQV
jgi:hypothetical protein